MLEQRRVTPDVPPVHEMAGEARPPVLRGRRPRRAALSQRRQPSHGAPAAAHVCRYPRRHRAHRLRRLPGPRVSSRPRASSWYWVAPCGRSGRGPCRSRPSAPCERGAARPRRVPGAQAARGLGVCALLPRAVSPAFRLGALGRPGCARGMGSVGAGTLRVQPHQLVGRVLFLPPHRGMGVHFPHPHGGGQPRALSGVPPDRHAAGAT